MSEQETRGRPPIPEADRKDATLRVRLRAEDRERLEEAARKADKSMSDYARDVLLRSLKGTR